jgi:hypothetical protein
MRHAKTETSVSRGKNEIAQKGVSYWVKELHSFSGLFCCELEEAATYLTLLLLRFFQTEETMSRRLPVAALAELSSNLNSRPYQPATPPVSFNIFWTELGCYDTSSTCLLVYPTNFQ